MDEDLDSCIVLDSETKETQKRKREEFEDGSGRHVTILSPKIKRTKVFLTPVKRTRRSVISGIRSGDIKKNDGKYEILGEGNYLSLVECIRKIEEIEKRKPRESIDGIVRKYVKK